ncbi:MAG: tetratricopeptide repeat protein [Elusimicrobia bacterium]|nr:tetratricopeptide repeat protein [Elusimicrobiota bacterium]
MVNKKHILAIIIFGFLVYSNTLKNPYLWDDGLFIQNGNFIKKFENAKVFFSPKNYFKYTQDLTYRPLPFLVHMVNYKIWGVNPVGHRLTNIFLHIAVAILLYFLILEIFKNNIVAFLSGLFFVVHPASTEVVNMVSFLETQLSTLFFLASFLFYVVAAERSSAPRSKDNALRLHVFSVVSYFLAVFSKETAITLPAVIILYDLTQSVIARSGGDEAISNEIATSPDGHRGSRNDIIKKYLPFLAVGIFYLIVRFFIFRHPTETMVKYPGDSFITNVFVILKAVPIYLSMIFLPFNLSVEHNIKIPTTFFQTPVIFGLLTAIIFSVISIYSYKKSKPVFFWLMFSAITFLPTSNIIPMQNIVAERYLYLPLIGICILLALLLKKISSRFSSVPILLFSSVPILLYFSALTVIRNLDWKSDFVFYSKTLEQVPDSPGINSTLGLVYARYKNYPKAFELINYALKLDPEMLDGQGALASIYQDKGDYDKALALYEKMVAEKKYTYHKAPFFNLGIIYKIKKQYNRAIENFNKAIKLNPLLSVSYAHLAEIYETHDDIEKATELYKKSVEINPDDYIPLNALGILYSQKNLQDDALKYLKKGLKLKPNSVEINFNIGYAYYLSYRYGESLKMLEKTLKLDPNYERAKFLISQIKGKTE